MPRNFDLEFNVKLQLTHVLERDCEPHIHFIRQADAVTVRKDLFAFGEAG